MLTNEDNRKIFQLLDDSIQNYINHTSQRSISTIACISPISRKAQIIAQAKSLTSAFQMHDIKMIYDILKEICIAAQNFENFPIDDLFSINFPSLILSFFKFPYNEYIFSISLQCISAFSDFPRFANICDEALANYLLSLIENPGIPTIDSNQYIPFKFPFLLPSLISNDICVNAICSIGKIIKHNDNFRDFILSKNILPILSKFFIHKTDTINLHENTNCSLLLIANLFYLPINHNNSCDVTPYLEILLQFLQSSDRSFLIYSFYGLCQFCKQGNEYVNLSLRYLDSSMNLFFNPNYSTDVLNEALLFSLVLLNYQEGAHFVFSSFSWKKFNNVWEIIDKILLSKIATGIISNDIGQALSAYNQGTMNLFNALLLNGTFEEKLCSIHTILTAAQEPSLCQILLNESFLAVFCQISETEEICSDVESIFFIKTLLNNKNNHEFIHQVERSVNIMVLRQILEKYANDEKYNSQLLQILHDFDLLFDVT
ncbi:hypothetical protein TRFO_32932 [Tritrichomonas foetus]|uniref:Armadillo repeat-containing domain-containing protein n=1 Tax=Tritrichomonas foetus TaxID=1144522 RepID=A0A1J4JNX1_9EUKA|nr:hypothetical protein TRFO_32932 [Tritrichomonas foetus]|eukprot:OHT00426.1 hypothetical protein TRFO_32932 [Tritrichomonas foetus]